MNSGFISLHRKILDWEWWQDKNTSRLFIYILLSATHKQNKWQNMLICRGQLVTSYESLALGTGLTVQNVRTGCSKLKSTGEITIKTTNKFSLITVVKYDDYQPDVTNKSTGKLTNDQQTTNKQLTTNNNDNNVNNVKKEKEKEKSFFSDPYKVGGKSKIFGKQSEPTILPKPITEYETQEEIFGLMEILARVQ